MSSDISAQINISALDNASGVIGTVVQSIQGMLHHIPGPAGAVASALVGVGATAIGLGAQAVKMAATYQEGLTSLVTGAGEAQSNMQLVSNGMLNIAQATGTSTQLLLSGMYMIESAGYHGAQGLSVLQTAAEGAKVGSADLGTVANALTTVLTDYHMSGDQAAQAMNGLTATVASGKTHLQDLATAMGSVLPLASSLGLQFPQVAGAIATMTNAGMSAQRASMNLANAIRSLAAPGGSATKAIQSVGLTAQELKNELSSQGLTGAIEMVNNAIGKKFPAGSVDAVTAFKAIMGGATGYNVALMLGGKNMATFQGDVKNIAAAMQQGGNTVTGWALVQQDWNFKMSQAKELVETTGIKIGTMLLPILGRLFDWFTSTGSTILGWIQNLDPTGIIYSFKQLGGTISSVFGTISGIVSSLVKSGSGGFGPAQLFGQGWNQVSQMIIGVVNNVSALIKALSSGLALLKPALSIIGQLFAGWRTEASAVMQAVGSMLIPAIQNLASAVFPVVAAFLKWIQASGLIPIIFNVIAFVAQVVVGAISLLINIIAALVTFFSQTALGVAMFRAILVILGVVMVTIAVIILTTVIPAFIAWVAGAIAVGIANIIAFAPIVLIVLAIIAVVTVVILIITHWGQIAAWLQNAWKATASFFGNMFSAIGTAAHNAVAAIGKFFSGMGTAAHNAVTTVGGWFSQLGTHAHGAMTSTGNAFQGGMTNIKNFAQSGVNGVVGAFSWMYNHNYYFKDLVDSIKSTFTNGVKFWTGVWTNFTSWLGGVWNGTKNVATTVWSAISSFFSTTWQAISSGATIVWNAITSFLSSVWKTISSAVSTAWKAISTTIENFLAMEWRGITIIWNKVISFLAGIWNSIWSAVVAMWSKISAVFGAAWNTYIATPLGNLWKSIWTAITGWGGQALNAGKNLISMLAQGIASGAGAIWNAVTGIAKNIWSALGFHSPAEAGPGADADKWMPNLISMLSSGLVAGVPKMQSAVNTVAVTLTPLAVQSSASPVTAPGAPSHSQASSGVSIGDIHVHLGDSSASAQSQGRSIANVVKQELANALRQQSTAPRFTTGGR